MILTIISIYSPCLCGHLIKIGLQLSNSYRYCVSIYIYLWWMYYSIKNTSHNKNIGNVALLLWSIHAIENYRQYFFLYYKKQTLTLL